MLNQLDLGFTPSESWLRQIQTEVKLALMITLGFFLMQAGLAGLALFSLACLAISFQARLSWRKFMSQTKAFLVVLALVFMSRAISTPGQAVWSTGLFSFTGPGLHEGLVAVWRLFLALALSWFFLSSSRLDEIKEAIIRLTGGARLGRRLAVMLSLCLSVIPLTLDRLNETKQALQARGFRLNRNPLRRVYFLSLPTLVNSITRADELSLALEARGFESSPLAMDQFRLKKMDKYALAAGALMVLGLAWL